MDTLSAEEYLPGICRRSQAPWARAGSRVRALRSRPIGQLAAPEFVVVLPPVE